MENRRPPSFVLRSQPQCFRGGKKIRTQGQLTDFSSFTFASCPAFVVPLWLWNGLQHLFCSLFDGIRSCIFASLDSLLGGVAFTVFLFSLFYNLVVSSSVKMSFTLYLIPNASVLLLQVF